MLPSRREHRFQKISVSAIYLNYGLKITSQTDHLDAAVALKTRPKRLKSAPTRSPRRFLAVFGVSWGALGCLWTVFARSGASWAYPRASSGAIFKALALSASFHYYIEVAIIQPLAAERPRPQTIKKGNEAETIEEKIEGR